ncbi:MAG: hypothetical protein KC496_11015, partial [Anaerolineae bacterium]|nr:hypothetical protein [Anaerolineae bacterium]
MSMMEFVRINGLAGAAIVAIAALIYLATHTMPGYYNPPQEGDRSSEDLLRELFNKGRDAWDSLKKALERGIPWVLPFDRTQPDDNDPEKHISLGFDVVKERRIVQGVDFGLISEPDALRKFTDNLNALYLPFGKRVYMYTEWPMVGISTTDDFPQAFMEAMNAVRSGDVKIVHFNLRGIVPAFADTYNRFADQGKF